MMDEMTKELNDLKSEMRTLTPRNNRRSLIEAATNEDAPIEGGFSRNELEQLLLEMTEDLEECKEAFQELQKDA